MQRDISSLLGLQWRKSGRSLGNGECIEVARAGKWIAVRDSKDPDGKILSYSETSWQTFMIQAKEVAVSAISEYGL